MKTTEQQVRMAAQLYEARNAAKTILGAEYRPLMTVLADVLRTAAATEATSELAVAISMAKGMTGTSAIFMLAAAVELTEPSEA